MKKENVILTVGVVGGLGLLGAILVTLKKTSHIINLRLDNIGNDTSAISDSLSEIEDDIGDLWTLVTETIEPRSEHSEQMLDDAVDTLGTISYMIRDNLPGIKDSITKPMPVNECFTGCVDGGVITGRIDIKPDTNQCFRENMNGEIDVKWPKMPDFISSQRSMQNFTHMNVSAVPCGNSENNVDKTPRS